MRFRLPTCLFSAGIVYYSLMSNRKMSLVPLLTCELPSVVFVQFSSPSLKAWLYTPFIWITWFSLLISVLTLNGPRDSPSKTIRYAHPTFETLNQFLTELSQCSCRGDCICYIYLSQTFSSTVKKTPGLKFSEPRSHAILKCESTRSVLDAVERSIWKDRKSSKSHQPVAQYNDFTCNSFSWQ